MTRRWPTATSEPVRTCVGCRLQATPEPGWRRIAIDGDGVVRLGRGAPGRGAWCCTTECFDRAIKRQTFNRAFRRNVPSDQLEAVRARLNDL